MMKIINLKLEIQVSIIECKPFSKNKKFQVMDGSK